ncbi:MAG: SGNH/GDSL hydrolase family protein [Steroidobacteraceae bacterium]
MIVTRKACYAAWYVLLSLAACSIGQASEWVQTWGAAPVPATVARGPFPASPSFANQTIRQIVRVSVGGSRVRIRFSNEYGTKPLVIGAAFVALSDEKGNVQPGTERRVMFSGQATTSIPAAAPWVSDPVDLPVKPLTSLSISVYFPADTGPCTCHQTGMQNAFVSATGDFAGQSFVPKQTLQMRAFLSGVDVLPSREARVVVALGDSITDGVGSTADADRRWPDLLANRLDERSDAWGVVNMGISGNRLLADGAGQSALARFDRDVLSVPGAKVVIVFLGVNDLGISYGNMQGPMARLFNANAGIKVTFRSMQAGYRQLITRAHAKGLKVFGATITPYGGSGYYSTDGDAVRGAINTWIRTSHEFDGVIDFDAVMRDPGQPNRIKESYQHGDHLHGSDAGYAAMAQAIQLSLFK